jgi:hypothetical protein
MTSEANHYHVQDSHGDRHLGHGTWGMRDKFKFYQ